MRSINRECSGESDRGSPRARWLRLGILIFLESPRSVLLLRIARKHLDDVIVQAVVQLLLEGPGKLWVIDLAGIERHHVNVKTFQPATDINGDAFAGRARFENKQRMFVAGQFAADFFDGASRVPPPARDSGCELTLCRSSARHSRKSCALHRRTARNISFRSRLSRSSAWRLLPS